MSYTVFIGRKLNHETRTWLLENDVCFSEQPLIEVELLAPDSSFFNGIKNENRNWVITSNWAAKWLRKYKGEIGFRTSDTVYCISEKQAEILADISSNILVSDEKNTKSLSKLVREKSNGETVIYLRGNKSLSIFQNEVGSKTRLFEIEVYRNIPVLQKITGSFDAYLFF